MRVNDIAVIIIAVRLWIYLVVLRPPEIAVALLQKGPLSREEICGLGSG